MSLRLNLECGCFGFKKCASFHLFFTNNKGKQTFEIFFQSSQLLNFITNFLPSSKECTIQVYVLQNISHLFPFYPHVHVCNTLTHVSIRCTECTRTHICVNAKNTHLCIREQCICKHTKKKSICKCTLD